MRNVGAQTQKKWRAQRASARRVGPAVWGLEGCGSEGSGGGPKCRTFFPFSRHNFHSFFFLSASSRGILVVFEAPGPSTVHV